MTFVRSAVYAAFMVATFASPSAAWTRASAAGTEAAKAQAATRTRLEAQRIQAVNEARLRNQQLEHDRINAILRADALSAQKRQLEAAAQAARAQKNLVTVEPSGSTGLGSSSTSVPWHRKLTGSRTLPSKFQGEIPAEDLKGLEPAKEPAQSERAHEPRSHTRVVKKVTREK